MKKQRILVLFPYNRINMSSKKTDNVLSMRKTLSIARPAFEMKDEFQGFLHLV